MNAEDRERMERLTTMTDELLDMELEGMSRADHREMAQTIQQHAGRLFVFLTDMQAEISFDIMNMLLRHAELHERLSR